MKKTFHKGFTPVDPRASRTNSNWKLELCSLRGIYVQASGGGLIKLPRQWFRPDLISSWLVLLPSFSPPPFLFLSSWTLSIPLPITKQQHFRSTFRLPSSSHPLTPLPLLSLNRRHRVNIGVHEIQSTSRIFLIESFEASERILFFDPCLLPIRSSVLISVPRGVYTSPRDSGSKIN